MKKKNLLICVLLSLAMVVTMFPATGFAASKEGTESNPFEIRYEINGKYGGNSYDCNLQEVWYKLTPKYDSRMYLETNFEKGSYDINKITLFDGSTKVPFTVTYDEEDDDWITYGTKTVSFKSGVTYLIKVELNTPMKKSDDGLYIQARPEDSGEYEESPAGTETDPVVFSYDSYSLEPYFAEYYSDEPQKVVWCKLEPKDSGLFAMNAYVDKSVISSIELMDGSKKSIAKAKYNNNYEAFTIDCFNVEKGKTYLFKVTLKSTSDYAYFSIYLQESSGTGTENQPFKLYENDTDYGLKEYWADSCVGNSKAKTLWYRATIAEDGKIAATFFADNIKTYKSMTKACISSAKVYVNSKTADAIPMKLSYENYKSEYFNVKKGDVIYVQVKTTSKFTSKVSLSGYLDYYGLHLAWIDMDSWDSEWTGKAIEPKINSVNFDDKELTPGKDYDAAYTLTDNVNMGVAELIVKGKGDYPGNATWYYEIKPLGTELTTAKAAKKSLTATWNIQDTLMSEDNITGYQIQYATSAKFKGAKTVTVKGYKKTSTKISKLTSGKKYYVRVRTYYDGSTWDVYSDWSKALNVKVK